MTNILLAFMREEGYKAGELMCAPRSHQKADASDSSGGDDDDEEQQSPVKSSLHGSTPDNGAKAPRDEDAKATVVAKKEANVAAFCDAIAEV